MRFVYFILSGLLLGLILGACGGGEANEQSSLNREPTKPLEVVVFNTQAPGTPTNTSTPLPTPEAVEPTATSTPKPATQAEDTIASEPTPTPTLVRAENENPLTGMPVADPVLLKGRPLHVRIGNDPQARPQVNLIEADLVYEEIVEWWITRLTAVYFGEAPTVAGPIRSARLINGQLTQQYHAALINSGGSDGVRWELSQLPIVNLDEYFHPKPYFYREGEPWQRRLAVNVAEAQAYLASQDLQNPVTLRGFMFDPTPANGNPAESIFVDYPAKESKVLWRFNETTGEYERFVGGDPFLDGATDQIISVPNVIIYFAEHSETDIVEDSTGATSVRININGEGRAWIFRDRTLLEGRWRTDGHQTPEFIDEAGQPIPLRPGRSWIQVVPTDYQILVNEIPDGFSP
jgi:hypothetical protein